MESTHVVHSYRRHTSSKGLSRSNADNNLYYCHAGNDLIILILYIDDILVTGSSSQLVDKLVSDLMRQFSMTDPGPVCKYLGVEFHRTPHGLLLHQTTFVNEILYEFAQLDCRPTHIPLNKGLDLRKDTGTTYDCGQRQLSQKFVTWPLLA